MSILSSIRSCLPLMALAACLAVTPFPAMAYIDPGSGSIVLQMILAAIAGGVFFFRDAFARFVGYFRRSSSTRDEPVDGEDRS